MSIEKLSTLYVYIAVLFIVVFFLSSCRKNRIGNPDLPTTESNGLPKDDESYISYYVVNNKAVTNAYYTSATNIGKFIVTSKNDTSFFTLTFTYNPVTSDITRINQFLFCDSSYDVNGIDEFDFLCRWTDSSFRKLTVGKVYNLNEIRDDNPVSVANSNGVASYYHSHRNLALVTTLNTTLSVNDPEANNSYLQISKMESNTISGTFSLAFGCPSGRLTNTVNYVKGIFNKVPIQE